MLQIHGVFNLVSNKVVTTINFHMGNYQIDAKTCRVGLSYKLILCMHKN